MFFQITISEDLIVCFDLFPKNSKFPLNKVFIAEKAESIS